MYVFKLRAKEAGQAYAFLLQILVVTPQAPLHTYMVVKFLIMKKWE